MTDRYMSEGEAKALAETLNLCTVETGVKDVDQALTGLSIFPAKVNELGEGCPPGLMSWGVALGEQGRWQAYVPYSYD